MTADSELFTAHDGVYLLSHSIGLPVNGMRAAVDGVLDIWEGDTAAAWPQWLAIIDAFRTELAGLIGAESASVCPQTNVSSGLTKILGALPASLRSDRPTVLISEHAFPTIAYVCEQMGLDVRFIPAGDDARDPAAWQRHLDGVDVAVITQVHSNTGELLPVDSISDVCSRHGVLTIVDVAQSVGIIPIDVTTWRADFVVGSCVKWLSGGPGAGWLWAHPNMIDRCEPSDVGWFSHADPFEFDIHQFRYADDALRFWGGTPTILPFAVARHSISALADVGIATVRAHNQLQIDRIIEALGPRVTSPHDRSVRSGTCIVAADESEVERLAAADIFVDARRGGLRVSPHLHTSSDHVDRAIAALRT